MKEKLRIYQDIIAQIIYGITFLKREYENPATSNEYVLKMLKELEANIDRLKQLWLQAIDEDIKSQPIDINR